MATGSTAEMEIVNLILEWRTMLTAWERDGQGPLDFSFFDVCKFSITHFLYDYQHLTHVYDQYLQSCKMSRVGNTRRFLSSRLMVMALAKKSWSRRLLLEHGPRANTLAVPRHSTKRLLTPLKWMSTVDLPRRTTKKVSLSHPLPRRRRPLLLLQLLLLRLLLQQLLLHLPLIHPTLL
jgi:hypothetical protein